MKVISDFVKATKTVYKQPRAYAITLVVAFIIFAVSISIPNSDFIRFTLGTDIFTFGEKVSLFAKQFGGFFTFFTLSNQISIIVISLLAGMNMAFFAHYLRRRIKNQLGAGVGVLGILSGFFGVGCSACGSVLLSSLIGIGATGQVVGILPLAGLEFSIISGLIILGANAYLGRQIVNPKVCRIEHLTSPKGPLWG